jgi:hypothetical protein
MVVVSTCTIHSSRHNWPPWHHWLSFSIYCSWHHWPSIPYSIISRSNNSVFHGLCRSVNCCNRLIPLIDRSTQYLQSADSLSPLVIGSDKLFQYTRTCLFCADKSQRQYICFPRGSSAMSLLDIFVLLTVCAKGATTASTTLCS